MHLLFDLDGTLTDSREGVVRCIQHALECMGRGVPPATALTTCVGPPLAGSFARLLETSDAALIDQAIEAYRQRFERFGMFENAVYPGIRDALTEFVTAGHNLCVVTVKPRLYARQILEYFALAGLFSAVYGPDLGDRQYTKSELIREACSGKGLAFGSGVMVGDRAEDILGAKESGLRSIGVTWGYGERAELEAAQPDRLVSSSEELVEYIRSAS